MRTLVPRGLPAVVVAALAWTAPLSAQAGDIDLSRLSLPEGFLELRDVTLEGPRPGVIVATGTTTFLGNVTRVLVSAAESPTGRGRAFTLALKPTDWSLTRMLPALSNPVLDNLTFQYVGLVVTDQDVTMPAAMLSGPERAFYREIYGSDDFTLTLKPGVNLIAAIPAETLEPDHPLNLVMDVLGIEKGVILLQGTLGKSLLLLTNPAAGGAAIIKDLYLRAELPPMRPPGSPAWFNSGQLALELTGLPSVRLVGEMNVNVQDDELMFFVAMTLARTGLTLAGGMIADSGWVAPFGVDWLTINKVVLLLGITPTGGVQLGFAGDAVFGEKDIAVALALTINAATGVPTNFLMQGESEAGVALSDIVTVQQRMAEAAGRPARLPVDALPNVALTDLGIKFAPTSQPELGITAGLALKGQLWLESGSGQMTKIAGVDVNVGLDGIWARGDLAAFQLGPLAMDATRVDLTATPQEQYFLLEGGVDLFGAYQRLDVFVSPTAYSFHSETVLWNLFHAVLEGEAELSLNPFFRVHAEMQNDFAEVIGPFLNNGLVTFAAAGQNLLAGSRAALTELDRILANREADVEEVRAALVELRRQADAAFAAARAVALQARQAAAATRRAANAAYRRYAGTSRWNPALRARRYARYARLVGQWRVQVGIANGLLAAATVRQRIVDAMPPVEENVLLRGAEAALAEMRAQTQTARDRLAVMERRYAQIVDAAEGGVTLPLTIERASFDAEIAGLEISGAVQWNITGTFLGDPFVIDRRLDFSNVVGATADMLLELIR